MPTAVITIDDIEKWIRQESGFIPIGVRLDLENGKQIKWVKIGSLESKLKLKK